MFRTRTTTKITQTPLSASTVARLQADALATAQRRYRIAAQQRFNETGLPRYFYSVRAVRLP